jgi:F-type H+-transporting ATPase subunit delta
MSVEQSPPAETQTTYGRDLAGWNEHLRLVSERLRADPDLSAALRDPVLSFTQKQKLIEGIIPGEADQEVRNFIFLLLEKGQMDLLDVITELQRLAEGGSRLRAAHVISAVPLTEEERATLRARLKARFGNDLDLRFTIEPAILGGLIVRVGDQVIDGSVAGKLDALRESLLSAR